MGYSNAVQGLSPDQYPLKMAPAAAGQLVSSRALNQTLTRYNTGTASVASVGTSTVGGTIGTETFTLTFTYLNLLGVSSTKIVTYAATSGQTAAQVAAALVALINADSDLNDVLVASAAGAVISYDVRRFRKVTAIAGSATGSATLTASVTISNPTPTEIPFGYAVGKYPGLGDTQCAAISTGTNLTVLGIAVRKYDTVAEYPYDPSKTTRGYPAESLVEFVYQGAIWVPVPVAVAVGTVPAILNATGQITANGASSSTAFAGARFESSTAGAGLAKVSLNLLPGV